VRGLNAYNAIGILSSGRSFTEAIKISPQYAFIISDTHKEDILVICLPFCRAIAGYLHHQAGTESGYNFEISHMNIFVILHGLNDS
jgi:hypothetical protein